ncbi:MAG: c-type cytochrome [Anaerolineales bacterium]|nr:c-type cytochrome [Anaerolineales bacterium]
MQRRILFRLLLVPFGIALLLAGLFFDIWSGDAQAQQTSTPDRLAEPTLPAMPNQADRGSQIYWLSCLPCHGDRGQGLTDEFREVYPPEDRNCWNSGCHGKRPYDDGFTLPTAIPAVVGAAALQKFSDAAALQAYVKSAMPYWKPGSLSDEEAWATTAFILRQSELWGATSELNSVNAARVKLSAEKAAQPNQPVNAEGGKIALIILVVILFLILFLKMRSKKVVK